MPAWPWRLWWAGCDDRGGVPCVAKSRRGAINRAHAEICGCDDECRRDGWPGWSAREVQATLDEYCGGRRWRIVLTARPDGAPDPPVLANRVGLWWASTELCGGFYPAASLEEALAAHCDEYEGAATDAHEVRRVQGFDVRLEAV